MGRRRKHSGGLALASDQIPGDDQNNISSGLVTFYCITTRPFAVTHNRQSTLQRRQMQATHANVVGETKALVGSRGRKGTVRIERDCMQAVER
jgi:hypothetical protein